MVTGMESRVWTVADHLAGQPAHSVEMYRRFVSMVEQCGPFSYSVAKTTITYKGSRRGFCRGAADDEQFQGWVREAYAV
jgi:hypothetical protein